jgi:surfeit locus 1 family protein
MASEGAPARPRFPLGLTLAVAVGVAVLIGLGVWQLQRLAWKERLLAHLAALKTAPAIPLERALTKGGDLDFVRVSVDCLPASGPSPRVFLYAVRGGAIAWRPISPCRIAVGPYDAIAVDRGVTAGDSPAPPALNVAPPQHATGVLRAPDRRSAFINETPGEGGGYQSRRAAAAAAVGPAARAPDVMLVVEQESPAPPGVTPQALPEDIPNNHLSYAITWFGLAAALVGVYLALLFRKAGAR